MKKLEEHMVLNPKLKKTFDDRVRKSKAKAKQSVRKVYYFLLLLCPDTRGCKETSHRPQI